MSMTKEVPEDLIEEFMGLEIKLTIFELRILFRAAAMRVMPHIMELLGWILTKNPQELLARAPFLTESCLLEMAQQQRLHRLGLIELNEDQTFSLTIKGEEAVKWWWGGLQDVWGGV